MRVSFLYRVLHRKMKKFIVLHSGNLIFLQLFKICGSGAKIGLILLLFPDTTC